MTDMETMAREAEVRDCDRRERAAGRPGSP